MREVSRNHPLPEAPADAATSTRALVSFAPVRNLLGYSAAVNAGVLLQATALGKQIYDNLGDAAFKGLRIGGSSRALRLTPAYVSATGKYPDPGTYRFRHVRRADRRGYPKDVANYSIRVYGCGDGTLPPSIAIRRVEAV